MVNEHRTQLMQLRALADTDVAAVLRAVSGGPVASVRDALIEALPEVLAPYLTASGELAAAFIEDLRMEAGRRGVFYAETAPVGIPPAKVEATARWAVAPLLDESVQSTVESRLSGSVARSIMDASRDTMLLNGGQQGIKFQRMPRPGCCAFCGMLASRPPWMAYKSGVSAGGAVQYERGGVSWSGTASHDECHCVVVPLYPGTEMASLAAATRHDFEEMYQQSNNDGAGTSLSATKDILAEWRRYHGTR
ncbi:hypothetical protein [Leucobacter luti]|nr:hypothetical protein [Leucobacter luti]